MVRLTMLGGFGLISGGIEQLRPRMPCGTHNSNAPISKPFCCGRGKPRWSMVSNVLGSAVSNAELNFEMAIVGVIPGEFSCNGPTCGSSVVTMPGQFELLDEMALPEPVRTVVPPNTKHCEAVVGPLPETIVFCSSKMTMDD